MCNTKSGLFYLKNNKPTVYLPLDVDSHEDMLYDLNLNDDESVPTFVKFEITPIDGNVFNHDLVNWRYLADQDILPSWYKANENNLINEAYETLQTWFKKRFVNKDESILNIKYGTWYVNGDVNCVDYNAYIKRFKSGRIYLNYGRIESVDKDAAIVVNNGYIHHLYGIITNNHEYVYLACGNIGTNYGIIYELKCTVGSNFGTIINFSDGVVNDNFGYIKQFTFQYRQRPPHILDNKDGVVTIDDFCKLEDIVGKLSGGIVVINKKIYTAHCQKYRHSNVKPKE